MSPLSRTLAVVALASAASACPSRRAPARDAAASAAPRPSPSAPPPTPPPPPVDAAVAAGWASRPPEGARPLLALSCVGARVSSSTVAARRTETRFLDASDLTAWSTAPGHIVGAWVEFDVPEGLSVQALRWLHGPRGTAGAAPTARATRVRVTRDGEPVGVGEFALDATRGDAQILPTVGAAGLWRIEVLASDAPTGADGGAWSLSVADLQLLGAPSEGVNLGSCMGAAVVGRDPHESEFRGGFAPPVASLEQWCARFLAQHAPRGLDGGADPARPIDPSARDGEVDLACAFGESAEANGVKSIPTFGGGPFLSATWITTWTPRQPARWCRLAVQTARGWSVSTPVARCEQDDDARMNYVAQLLGARVTAPDGGPPVLELHYDASAGSILYGDQEPGAGVGYGHAYLMRCEIGAGGGLRCATPHVSALRQDFISFPSERDGG